MRYRIGVLLVLVAVAALSLAASAPAEPDDAREEPGANTFGATGERTNGAERVELRRKKRPGCRRFCQQAGSFGGDSEGEIPVSFPSQKIRGTGDRLVEVRATCNLDIDCEGAIILDGYENGYIEYGRADLLIPSKATRDVRIGLTRQAKRHLERHGRDREAFATAPLREPGTDFIAEPVSLSPPLTLLPPR